MDRRRVLGVLEGAATIEIARKGEERAAARMAIARPGDAALRRQRAEMLHALERILLNRARQLGWDGTPLETIEAELEDWDSIDRTPTENLRPRAEGMLDVPEPKRKG